MSDEKQPSEQKSKKPSALKVVELPSAREVSEKHLADLKRSGLSDETIKLAELYTEHNSKKIAELMHKKVWPMHHGAALVFPFFTPDNKVIGVRIRPTSPRVTGKRRDGTPKHAKYDQPHDVGILVYFPPSSRTRGAYAGTDTLYWTEGEKKALVLDQLGLACVGLTGVWNWIDVPYKHECGGERLHEHIRDHVNIGGRTHVIVFDADARTNPDVMLAAGRFAGVLIAAGAAAVKFVHPLSPEHKGIDDYYVFAGETNTRGLLASAADIEPISPKDPLTKLRSIQSLRDAPIESDIRLPPGYEVDREGALWKKAVDDKHGDTKVARAPILIQQYLDDYYTGEGRVDVCFERDGRWVSTCVSRRALVDARIMVAELSLFGAPVTSNNCSKVIDWLDDLERVNVGRIPRIACIPRAGWHDIDGHTTFVLDEPIVPKGEDAPQLALDLRGDRRKLFGALKSCASGKSDDEAEKLEHAHRDALARAWKADDVAAALIAGALATPLLRKLHAPNFGVHLPGDSSRGKTSMLKIAGSVYGDPNSEQWVANWNITPVAAELRAATLCDLPQLYDEAGAADEEQTQRLVYMLINGGGKARGNATLQLRETPSWHTIVLSTGERRLADDTSATGAQIRIIHLPVSRFGDLGAEGVDELREACVAHAGAFGRMWIETLLETDDWAPIQAIYKDFVRILRAEAKEPLQARLASYVAVLCVAEHLASQLGLGEEQAVTMRRLFHSSSQRHHEVQSLADRARDAALNWVLAEQDAFPYLRLQGSGAEDAENKRAREVHGYRRDNGEILFNPDQFRTWCTKRSLGYHEVLLGWLEKGWLIHDPKRKDKQVRIGASRTRLIVLADHATDHEQLDFTKDEQAAIAQVADAFGNSEPSQGSLL